ELDTNTPTALRMTGNQSSVSGTMCAPWSSSGDAVAQSTTMPHMLLRPATRVQRNRKIVPWSRSAVALTGLCGREPPLCHDLRGVFGTKVVSWGTALSEWHSRLWYFTTEAQHLDTPQLLFAHASPIQTNPRPDRRGPQQTHPLRHPRPRPFRPL